MQPNNFIFEWGVINLLEGYGSDNPAAKARALSSSWLIKGNKKRKEKHNPDGISGRLQE